MIDMRLPLLLALACLTATGCVAMDAAQCRSANWFDTGFRDGLAGLQRMDAIYDHQCGKYGTKTDVAAYAVGWQDGHWIYAQRAIRDSTD